MSMIVFAFGRLNPPTNGHGVVIEKVLEVAKQLQSDHIVYLSQSQNNKTDPLEWKFKKRVCESAFLGVNFSKNQKIKTPFQALENLRDQGYSEAIFVVGEDRLDEFRNRMTPYADEWNIQLEVISAGKRITESKGVEGISGTKMRQFAIKNDKESFFAGLPKRLSLDAKNLVFENTKKGLKNIKK